MSVVIHKYVIEYFDEVFHSEIDTVIKVVSVNDFGVVKLNTDLISEIYETKSFSMNVSEKVLDDFLCTFFKNRICLIEKKLSDKILLRTIRKKYHSICSCIEVLNYLSGNMEKYFMFKNINYNYVIMNNSSKIMVLK